MPKLMLSALSGRIAGVISAIGVMLLAAGTPAQAQVIIKVNEDVNFKFGVLGQFQADWLEDPVHDDTTQNLFVRRIEDGEMPSEPDGALFASQRGFYEHMDEEKLRRVVREHCGRGEPVEELLTDY